MAFPTYIQHDGMDCGPTCLRMIARHYGKSYSLETLRGLASLTREGVSLLGISEAAERIGFKTLSASVSFEQLHREVPLPCILHWKGNHFVVVPPQSLRNATAKLLVADPAHGLVQVDRQTFLGSWAGAGSERGIVLLLEPTPRFFNQQETETPHRGFRFLLRYLAPYKKAVGQLAVGVLLSSLLALIVPFLTQSLVDNGVNHQDIGFIRLVLIAQLALFAGTTAVELIRNWILLHLNGRINVALLSDFLLKLMKLPIRFFDTKMIGDLNQRISDHSRIEQFLTAGTLNTLFSLVSLGVFAGVLGLYSPSILLLFLGGSALSAGWILLFLKKRKALDYQRFEQQCANQNSLYELITGMQEIKLNNCETAKRWGWERIQAKLFRLHSRGLALEQWQHTGNVFFIQLKNILITYLAAREVVSGQMTLGMMLSISYMIGQMNGPVEQLLGFFKAAQDARIGLERMGEIHDRPDEEQPDLEAPAPVPRFTATGAHNDDLVVEQLSFRYAGAGGSNVLEDVSLTIPAGKVTAIVGSSGSGKTTLLKLLLRFYEPTAGVLKKGAADLCRLSPGWWRGQCGVVLQEGFVFSASLAHNIAVGEERIDEKRLRQAVAVSNLEPFINGLPSGLATRIGNTGNGISTGQKQRVLIARAVYKNPAYLFFDEATSALDAQNERVIMENLGRFFRGRTVVVIAHRLSTVKNADQIIVLEKGRVVETGTHETLTRQKGRYYELVKNQLELGE